MSAFESRFHHGATEPAVLSFRTAAFAVRNPYVLDSVDLRNQAILGAGTLRRFDRDSSAKTRVRNDKGKALSVCVMKWKLPASLPERLQSMPIKPAARKFLAISQGHHELPVVARLQLFNLAHVHDE